MYILIIFESISRFTTELAGLGGDVSFLRNDFYWQKNFPIYQDIVSVAEIINQGWQTVL